MTTKASFRRTVISFVSAAVVEAAKSKQKRKSDGEFATVVGTVLLVALLPVLSILVYQIVRDPATKGVSREIAHRVSQRFAKQLSSTDKDK